MGGYLLVAGSEGKEMCEDAALTLGVVVRWMVMSLGCKGGGNRK